MAERREQQISGWPKATPCGMPRGGKKVNDDLRQCEIDATEGNFTAAKTMVGSKLLLETIHVQWTYGTSPLLSGDNQGL